MSNKTKLPLNFGSLPESRVDPSSDSDEFNFVSNEPSGARTPEVTKKGEKIILGEKCALENNENGKNSIYGNNIYDSPAFPVQEGDSPAGDPVEGVTSRPKVQRASSCDVYNRQTGIEEDYEDDETCIITEDDLGEIPVWPSENEDSDGQKLNSTIPDDPETTVEDSGRNYQLSQSELNFKRRRKAFYKQMLCSDVRQRRHTIGGEVLTFEPLQSPSQVLQLIRQFQTRIDNNGECDSNPVPMEDFSPAVVVNAIKKPPRIFPKHSTPANPARPPLPTSKMPKIQEFEYFEQVKPCTIAESFNDKRPETVGPNEIVTDPNHPATECDNCDAEALEAIEQLDKSIEEVVLSDEDFAKTIRVRDDQDGDERGPCPELTIDFDHVPEQAMSPVLTDEGFADEGLDHKCDVEVPRMTDAAVNTDFDVSEETENKEVEVQTDGGQIQRTKDFQKFTSPEAIDVNVVELVPKPPRGKMNYTPGNSQLEYSAISAKKGQFGGVQMTNGSSPRQRCGYLVNGHNEANVNSGNPDAEESTIYSRRNLREVEASHRMSTVTLDGAVVAQMEESSVEGASGVSLGHRHGHFVVVAIDFGTTFSGYAFSFIRDPDNIHIMRKWEGGDPGVINQKTLTTLLLTPDGAFDSVGFTARDHYHDLETEEAKRWLYFDKFKMALHHNSNLSKKTEIRAANGTFMPAVTVFAHVLRFFKKHALQELSDQTATRILNEDIRWVITVPAIWRQPAKQFMRQAAYESGIASAENPDQLLIALEPEAASIYCRKLKVHQLVSESQHHNRSRPFAPRPDDVVPTGNGKLAADELTPGTRYMVVDCGGGTVDITVHEITDKRGNLKELHKPTGGPCGSIMVDAEFERLLNDIFGPDFIEQFKTQRPAGFVDLMMAFEARKRNVNPFRNNPSNVSLPFSFMDYYKVCKGCTVESAVKRFERKDIRWSSQGMLRLEPGAMRSLFVKVIEDIKGHISQVLRSTNHTIKYLFLVGGFAESQILQQEIRNAFGELRIIIPQGVSLAILKGAVLYGREPTVVSVRRSRMTYGVGVLNRFIPKIHPCSKRIVKDGVEWCTDVFDSFVAADQSVGLGDVVLRSYTPARQGQTNIVLHVYCSEKESISFITDEGVRRCGTLHLDLSDVQYVAVPKRREIQTRMIFGDTEVKISALDVTTGKCVRAQLDFLNH